MRVRINGIDEMISEKTMTLQELVINRGLKPAQVVVEVNLQIIPREQWTQIILQDEDRIEIVSFVGGG
ncbi:MAG: sulfur carrier protein ThiS [Syntrophaceae bacterium]|nr:sulfur carrier protein ThiS [Syntrophaceae bacterium]NTW77563.1 sulfur carrier protein ThiS [Syntrophaceae bacterium]